MRRKESDYGYIYPDCVICGKNFKVKLVRKTGEIKTNCFHSYMNKHFFMKWGYGLDSFFNEHLPWYKRIFVKEDVMLMDEKLIWKIMVKTKFTRWLSYSIWKIFYGWQKIDYWECPKCANRKDD